MIIYSAHEKYVEDPEHAEGANTYFRIDFFNSVHAQRNLLTST